jgi:hypothetical protein
LRDFEEPTGILPELLAASTQSKISDVGCGSFVFIRTFEPTMTHDELEPIMATIGFPLKFLTPSIAAGASSTLSP